MNSLVGFPADVTTLPLRYLAKEAGVSFQAGPPRDIALKLRGRDLDAAVVSPIEYARESSEYRILPGPVVSSRSGVKLFFRDGLRTIKTMAVDPVLVSEIVLAKIVLREEFESAPAIVPVLTNNVGEMLSRADSALLAGHALTKVQGSVGGIDIAEAWGETMDLPYIHGLLCTREEALPQEDYDALMDLGSNQAGILKGFDVVSEGIEQADAVRSQALIDRFTYAFTEESSEALTEFLRYAHFHGILADIPELNYYASSDLGNPSSN